MEDIELIALKQTKQNALRQIFSLKKQIHEEKKIGELRQLSTTIGKLNSTEEDFSDNEYSFNEMHKMHKMCKMTRRISGIKFENTTKNWIKNCIYKYTTNVDTKVIKFHLELTVDLKNDPDFEIVDITCHFLDLKPCYLKEITSWVQSFSKLKNLSFLMSAISDYNYCNHFRQKIVTSLKENNYANIYEREEENGGVLLDIKSPKNSNNIYLKYLWVLNYVERTCRIDHHFLITATDFGLKFVNENTSLIKKFCKLSLKKQDLVELWAELCDAINTYDQNT